MKYTIVVLALMGLAVPAMADDVLLSKLGLQDMEIVSNQEAQQVVGRGYVYAEGWSRNQFDIDAFENFDIFDDVDGKSYQELYLQGLNVLEGLTGATNSFTFDFQQTEWDSTNQFDAAGSFSSSTSTIVAGSAN